MTTNFQVLQLDLVPVQFLNSWDTKDNFEATVSAYADVGDLWCLSQGITFSKPGTSK